MKIINKYSMLLSAFLSILAIITSCNDDKDEMNYYHRVKPIKVSMQLLSTGIIGLFPTRQIWMLIR